LGYRQLEELLDSPTGDIVWHTSDILTRAAEGAIPESPRDLATGSDVSGSG